MKTQPLLITLIAVFWLPYSLKAQTFQQNNFVIGTFLEPSMGIGADTLESFCFNTLSGAALTDFYNKRTIYLQKLQNIKDAHFNLMTGVKKGSDNLNAGTLMYNLNLLANTPSLDGLKSLIHSPAMFGGSTPPGGSVSALGPNSPFLGSWRRRTIYEDFFSESAIYYPNYCPDGDCWDALYGFHIMDEPTLADLDSVRAWGQYFDCVAPGKLAYINLGGGRFSDYAGRLAYEDYVDQLASPTMSNAFEPQVFSYDYYPFIETKCLVDSTDQGTKDIGKRCKENYFYGLSTMKRLAGDKPFWAYPLSIGHSFGQLNTTDPSYYYSFSYNALTPELNYAVPDCHCGEPGGPVCTQYWPTQNEDSCASHSTTAPCPWFNWQTSINILDPTYNMLMFMDFCPIAYGAKGLIYFSYEPQNNNGTTFWGEGITGHNGEITTQRYPQVKNLNHFIEKIAGPVVMSSEWKGAFHKSNSPTNEASLISTGALANELLTSSANYIVEDVDNSNILFGIFRKSYDSNCGFANHLFVVNKDLSATPDSVRITLKQPWYAYKNLGGFGTYDIQFKLSPAVRDTSNPYSGSTTYSSIVTQRISSGGLYYYKLVIPPLQGGEGRMILLDSIQCFGTINSGTQMLNSNSSSYLSPIVRVTPNPVNQGEEITIAYETFVPEGKVAITLIDYMGAQYKVYENSQVTMGEHEFKLGGVPAGLYHVVVQNEELMTHKLLQVVE